MHLTSNAEFLQIIEEILNVFSLQVSNVQSFIMYTNKKHENVLYNKTFNLCT